MTFESAPPSPERRRSFGASVRRYLGLTTLAVAIALSIVAGYIVMTANRDVRPQDLYFSVWSAVPDWIYDPAELKDWNQWDNKFNDQIKTDADAVKFANQMLSTLKDPYTVFMSRENMEAMNRQTRGEFVGIGVGFDAKFDAAGKPVLKDGEPLVETDSAGNPLIGQVLEGGPAEKAGLKAGDAVVRAGDVSVKDMPIEALMHLLKGAAGTTVKLTVINKGAERQVDIVRGAVHTKAVTTKRFGDIGYIRLSSFMQDDTLDEMADAMNELADCKFFILDLRGNPGGRIDICHVLISMFMDEGDMVKTRHHVPYGGHETTTYHLAPNGIFALHRDEDTGRQWVEGQRRAPNFSQNKKLIILVDHGSASASEMFTGALQDNGRADVLGEQTYGKGVGQLVVPLPNGTALKITNMRYFTPNGTWVGDGSSEHHGIKPNHVVAPRGRYMPGSENDTQLKAAIELFRKAA